MQNSVLGRPPLAIFSPELWGPKAGPFSGKKLVVASAAYDILVTTPLIVPFGSRAIFEQMRALHIALGSAGAPLPAFAPMHLFFVGLLASVVTIWSLLRLFRPSVLLGKLDGVTRLLFSGWMVWALSNGQSHVLMGYLVIELSFGVAQLLFVRSS